MSFIIDDLYTVFEDVYIYMNTYMYNYNYSVYIIVEVENHVVVCIYQLFSLYTVINFVQEACQGCH